MSAPIGGECDPRFASVRAAFEANFAEHGDVGAGVVVEVEGQRVVDLWGGWRDEARTLPWAPDTLVNAFSTGKAVATICVLRLVEQGALGLDAAVGSWWPEFSCAGKETITLRQLLSHRGGLPAIHKRLPEGSQLDHGVMAAALAADTPWWEPNTAHGYHVNTFGFLAGEAVRRAAGITLGEYLAREVAGPLGADFFVGLPESEDHRVADFLGLGGPGPGAELPEVPDDQRMHVHAYNNPIGLSGGGILNTRAWRAAELPSTNGHASARGLATIYAGLLAGSLLGPELLAEATTEHSVGTDLVLGRPSRFGIGFQLTQPERPLGPNPNTFGHFGAGGALGFCDPDAGVAFAYVMNMMGPRWNNPRNRGLIDAVYASL